MFLLFAILPGVFLVWLVYSMDKIEKEPKGFLTKLFFWGAFTCVPILFVELAFMAVIGKSVGGSKYLLAAAKAYLVAGLVEETFKYLFLKWKTWKSPEFNYTFDGVVYAVVVSMGYATLENILYVCSAPKISTVVVRAVLSVPGHAIFGVFMGANYGLAKLCERYNDTNGRDKNLRRAWLYAIFLHGTYDFCLMTGDAIIVLPYILFELGFTVRVYKKLKLLAGADRRLM